MLPTATLHHVTRVRIIKPTHSVPNDSDGSQCHISGDVVLLQQLHHASHSAARHQRRSARRRSRRKVGKGAAHARLLLRAACRHALAQLREEAGYIGVHCHVRGVA